MVVDSHHYDKSTDVNFSSVFGDLFMVVTVSALDFLATQKRIFYIFLLRALILLRLWRYVNHVRIHLLT